VDKDAIKGILQRYVPPLSETLVDEIANAIFSQITKGESQSQQVTASSKGRTLRKRK
jgi:hypothetical protein